MDNLHHHILGVYPTRDAAQQALSRLLELGLNREQLNLIEPGEVPVGEPTRLDASALVTNMDLNRVDLDGERVFSDIVKQALREGQVVIAGHTTTEEQTAWAQGVLNQSMHH